MHLLLFGQEFIGHRVGQFPASRHRPYPLLYGAERRRILTHLPGQRIEDDFTDRRFSQMARSVSLIQNLEQLDYEISLEP